MMLLINTEYKIYMLELYLHTNAEIVITLEAIACYPL